MKNNVLIVHPYFRSLGGAEYLCLTLTETLIDSGYSVLLYTIHPPDLTRVKSFYNINLKYKLIKILKTNEFNIPAPMLLKKMINYNRIIKGILCHDSFKEYIVIDTQLNIPWAPHITYIHYPYLIEAILKGIYNNESLYKQIYYRSLLSIYNVLFSKNISKIILTNSTWTKNRIRNYLGVNAMVLYPPVDINFFSKAYSNDKREKIVITISRMSPEKKLEKILYVAKELPDYIFIIIGSIDPKNAHYLHKLLDMKEKLRLSNIYLLVNVPRQYLLKLLKIAKYYLHPPLEEHFGISVVEAMAAGLVPIVYRRGGTWSDIVSKINLKLGYLKMEEVPNIIKTISQRWQKLSQKSHQVSKEFSKEKFSMKILKYISYIHKYNR